MKFTAVKVLIAANVLFYLLQYTSPSVEYWLALWPLSGLPDYPGGSFHAWQLVSYAFLHDPASIYHLLFNMLGLYMFGSQIEAYVGPSRLLTLYFASVITAAITQLLVPGLFGEQPNITIGASGGVFGLLLAYAMLFPKRRVVPLIPPIPMPAWLFATLYSGVELFAGVTGRLSGVAHFAHLGGMVGSFLVTIRWLRARRAA